MPVITCIEDLQRLAQRRVPRMFYEYGDSGSWTESTYRANEAGFAPVLFRQRVMGSVGLNYEMHRQETGRPDAGYPTIFTRFANSQTGHLSPMIKPKLSREIDYEGELAVVFGKSGRHIPRDQAREEA